MRLLTAAAAVLAVAAVLIGAEDVHDRDVAAAPRWVAARGSLARHHHEDHDDDDDEDHDCDANGPDTVPGDTGPGVPDCGSARPGPNSVTCAAFCAYFSLPGRCFADRCQCGCPAACSAFLGYSCNQCCKALVDKTYSGVCKDTLCVCAPTSGSLPPP
ncbi:hypothetical protein ONE63_002840 [Megalurothrips usitatus]|uniref:Uncharacterized protein n=1 Tax=Megalurothrips usitatus TaxID=439358 RepID=A0AAV7XCG2_9NEOP|nr:hypothetical protein ONE63_002840 [Megalurothrips usitatus]